MAAISPRALRHIVSGVEEMTSAPGHDAATERRLELQRRRLAVRVTVAARQLAEEASAEGAPAELRRLAASVRAGNATWEQCVAGRADDLPEVRSWLAAEGRPQPNYLDENEDVMLRFLLRRDDGRDRDGR
jgi:hypothetical protein